MSFLSALKGMLVPVAHAALEDWGAQGEGVSAMWSAIRDTLHTRQDPVNALSAAVLNFIFPLIGGIAVLMFLYAGIKMIWGRGNDESFSEAKTIMYHALLGVVLAILAAAIVAFFVGTFLPLFLS